MELWEEYLADVVLPPKPLRGQLCDDTPPPVCGLCGNTGILITDRVRTSAGYEVKRIARPCICPNGRHKKKEGESVMFTVVD